MKKKTSKIIQLAVLFENWNHLSYKLIMNYRVVALLVWGYIAFVFCACAGEKDRFARWDKTFTECRELQSVPLLDDELILGRIGAFEYVDSSLFIYDDLADSLFLLIDLKNQNRIYRFGQKGQGADEFLQPFSVCALNADTLLGVYDLFQRKLRVVNTRQVKRGVEKFPVLREDTLGSIGLYATRYGTYLGKGFYEKNMLSLTGDSMGRKYFFEYPYRDDRERDIPNRLRGMAYQGKFCSNQSLDRFVFAISEAPIFMLFAVDESDIIKNYEWIGGYPGYEVEETENSSAAPFSADNITSFVNACATDRYVYLLYSGKTFREAKDKAFQGTVVYRLTWEGVPVDKLLLDYPAAMICVSSDDKILYSMAEKGELEIVQYLL